MIADEFVPADPAVWFDAAMSAGARIMPYKGAVYYDKKGEVSDGDKCDFLFGWLIGTPDGERVPHDWMKSRGIKVAG